MIYARSELVKKINNNVRGLLATSPVVKVSMGSNLIVYAFDYGLENYYALATDPIDTNKPKAVFLLLQLDNTLDPDQIVVSNYPHYVATKFGLS